MMVVVICLLIASWWAVYFIQMLVEATLFSYKLKLFLIRRKTNASVQHEKPAPCFSHTTEKLSFSSDTRQSMKRRIATERTNASAESYLS